MILEISEINFEMIDGKHLIGLDVGDKTIGVAVSDKRCSIASGLNTIERGSNDIEKLEKLIAPYTIGLFVVGWPVQMNGTPGEQCKKVQLFIDQLEEWTETPIIKWDERFSTKVVESVLISADVSRKRRKKYVDKIAAAYFLQGAIDYFNRKF